MRKGNKRKYKIYHKTDRQAIFKKSVNEETCDFNVPVNQTSDIMFRIQLAVSTG